MFEEVAAPETLSGWPVPGVPVQRVARLSPELLALQAAIDAVAALDMATLDGRDVLAETTALLAQAQRLQLLGLGRLAEVDRRGLHELAGATSTARWVQAQGVAADASSVAVARRLATFPLIAQALLDGRVGLPVAQRLHAALLRLRPHLDRPDGLIDGQPAAQVLRAVVIDGVRTLIAEARGGFPDADPALPALIADLQALLRSGDSELVVLEGAFLLLARQVEPGQLAGCLALLTDALLPLQLQAREKTGHDRRAVRLVRRPDRAGFRLDGELDLECGERLLVMLRAELLRDPDSPADTAAAAALREQGLDPYDPAQQGATAEPAPRLTGQLLHDALTRGLARYLAADLGGTHDKNPVQIVVTVPAEALDNQPGALPARTGNGSPVPVTVLRRWVCGSAITRHVLNLTGKVLAVSHTERTLTATERRALHTQTRGNCQAGGCRRSSRQPGTVLHPHHANPWSLCGTTSLADTVLLCDSCHHQLHDRGRPIYLKNGRTLGPNGWLPT